MIYNYTGAKYLMLAKWAESEEFQVDVSDVDYYSIIRYIMEESSYEEVLQLLQQALKDSMEDDHEEALTMDEMIAKDPTIKDEWEEFNAMLDQQDLGDVDPSCYQFEEDEGCEGGACKL